MIFSSIDYFIFFTLFILSMIFIKNNKIKKALLLIASYFFYAYWDYRFVFLMLALSIVNYFVGIKIEQSDSKKEKKILLAIGVTFDLVVLGFFKYFNFFIDSLNTAFGPLGVNLSTLDIILPIAISFIVFEVISYIVDIYRGTNESAGSFWDLAILVAFFPHLIAGPILKPNHFLPQLKKDIIIKWENVELGVQIFLIGMIKKILIADQLAIFVDPVFADPSIYSGLTIWLAVIAYAIQIFCDFSGYTDMAIGSAKCLGFEIPPNFSMPYISKSITEFWRRWHISLSTWLKEYLYISLGGNRKGPARQYINLFLVMLLGGLWHGASWNFVVWGGMHGVGLAVHKLYSGATKELEFKEHFLYNFVCWLVTFLFVCFTWVFFRSSDFSKSMLIVNKMLFIDNSIGIDWMASSILIILPFVIAAHYIGTRLKDYPRLSLATYSGLFCLFFTLLALLLLRPTVSSPFIYFQF